MTATDQLPNDEATFARGTLVVGTWGSHEGVLYRVVKSFVPASGVKAGVERVVVREQLGDPDERETFDADELTDARDYDSRVFYKRPASGTRHTRSGITRNGGNGEPCPVCEATHREWAQDSMVGIGGEWCAVCGFAFAEMG